MMETVRVFKGRPAFINGEWIAIHDAAYLRERSEWRKRLLATHSDHGGSTRANRKIQEKYEAWKAKEVEYYDKFNLDPPSPQRLKEKKIPHGQVGSLANRVLLLLRKKDYSSRQLSELTGRPQNAIMGAICRMRQRGAVISLAPDESFGGAYRLYRDPAGRETGTKEVLAALLNGKDWNADALAEYAKCQKEHVSVYIHRLRKDGHVIAKIDIGATYTYKLISLHEPAEKAG